MAEGLGLWLRRARESRQLTLEQARRELHIHLRYLQALEMDDYTALPGEIQVRGFLRNYARFLGLPVEEALARYEAEIEGRPLQLPARAGSENVRPPAVDRPTVFAPPPTENEVARPTSGIPGGILQLLIGAMLFFALLALGSFLYLQFAGPKSEPLVTPAVTPVQTPATAEPGAEAETANFEPAVDGTVTIRLEPAAHAWVRLVADGEIVFQGVATPEQKLQAVASERCLVEAGDGSAFHLYVNGADWGLLGNEGQTAQRAWSPTGEISLQGP